jgi:hypothetical protein
MKEEKGAQLHLTVCTQLRMQLYLMVGTRLLLLYLDLQASSCHRPFTRELNKTTGCLSPLRGQYPPGYGNNHVSLSINAFCLGSGLVFELKPST